jgi:RHS repeat-associated protein
MGHNFTRRGHRSLFPFSGLAAWALLVTLVLPYTFAFAEGLPTPPPPPAATTTQDTPEPAPAPAPSPVPAPSPQPELTAPAAEDGGTPPPSILDSDPDERLTPLNVRDSLRHTQEPDPSDGSFSYVFPMRVPPGRNGIQPDLALRYNSGTGNKDGYFGVGWSINIPYIQRLNKKGTDRLYTASSTPYFYASEDGELATTSANTTTSYAPKMENGDFRQYTYSTTTGWTVTDKSGMTYTYGTTTDSQQKSTGTNVFKWMLDRVQDANGNFMTYEYYREHGNIYPSKIKYTHQATSTGAFEVEFIRTNYHNFEDYSTGFLVNKEHRITEVQMKINGSWVTKYDFTYTTGDSSFRSMLSSISETGKDEDGNALTLSAATFTYQTLQTAQRSWTEDGNWGPPQYFTGGTNDLGSRFSEVNGDGLIDFVRDDASSPNVVYVNNDAAKKGWSSTGMSNPRELADGARDTGARVLDVNGDGFTDVIKAKGGSQSVDLNNGDGTGWNASSSWVIPVNFTSPDGLSDYGVRFGDVNGDGLNDMVQALQSSTTAHRVFTNNGDGTGWTYQSSYSVSTTFDFTTGTADLNVQMEDMNGDGLADFAAGNRVYINNGDGTWGVDVAASVYMNRGKDTFISNSEWSVPAPFLTSVYPDAGTRLADVNGDGLIDVIRGLAGVDNTAYLNQAEPVDLLTNVTEGTGGKITVKYKGSAEYYLGTSTIANPNLPFVLQTVNAIVRNDGYGTIGTTTYEYSGGDLYFKNQVEKKFAGFEIVTKTDPVGNVTKTFYHQGNTSSSTKGEYNDDIFKAGKPYRIEKYDNNGNLLAKTINKWDDVDLTGNDRKFVKLQQSVDFAFDGDSDHRELATSYAYNATGSIIGTVAWGEVAGSDDGTFTDTPATDLASTSISYVASSTGTLLLPSQETTRDYNGTKVKETAFYYDSNAATSSNISKGNVTKVSKWKSGTSYVTAQKSYTPFGLVSQDVDALGATTTYRYDSYQLYPATTTDPLSHATQVYYDYSLGKPATTTDQNSRTFVTVYDGLDRPETIKEPDKDTPTTLNIKTAYVYTDSGSRNVKEIQYLNSATTTALFRYFDGFDRTIKEFRSAEASSTYSERDLAYDKRGLLLQESIPYFTTGSPTSSNGFAMEDFESYSAGGLASSSGGTNWVGAWGDSFICESDIVVDTSSGIDGPNSLKVNANSNTNDTCQREMARHITGTESVSFKMRAAQTTDRLIVSIMQGSDPTANGVGIQIQLGSNGKVRAMNNLTWVDLGSYVADTPYTIVVFPDVSTESYTLTVNGAAYGPYNFYAYGTTAYTELRYFNVQDGADIASGYLYLDSIMSPAGSAIPAATTSFQAFTRYFYDGLGRPASTSNAVGTTTYSYDDWRASTTDPLGHVKGIEKDAFGNLVRVNEVNATSTYATVYTYDRIGDLTKITDALGNVRNFTYDALGRRLTAEDLHVSGDGTYGTWTFTYDDNGNLTSQVDPKSQTVNFTYDAVNRPLSENYTGQGGTEVLYTYDSCTEGIGRLCIATSTGAVVAYSYWPSGLKKSELYSIASSTSASTSFLTTFAYDRQGNMTGLTYPDNAQTAYSYNSAGLLEAVSHKESGGATSTLLQDIDYGPHGKVTFQDFLNGVVSTSTYDANALWRLSNKATLYDSNTLGSFITAPFRKLLRIISSSTRSLLSYANAQELIEADAGGSSSDDGSPINPNPVPDEDQATIDDLLSSLATTSDEGPSDTAATSTADQSAASPEVTASTTPDIAAITIVEEPDPAVGKAAEPIGTERPDRLSWNVAKAIELPTGEIQTEFRMKWMRYLDENGSFKPIDPALVETSDGWCTDQMPFKACFPLHSSGTALFHNNNRYDPTDHTIIRDEPLDLLITSDGADATGTIERGDIVLSNKVIKNTQYALYRNVFENTDLIYLIDYGQAPRLVKVYRCNQAPCPNPAFHESYSREPDIYYRNESGDRTLWSKEGTLHIPEGGMLTVQVSEKRGIGKRPFVIWDSGETNRSRKVASLDTTITRTDAGFAYEKLVSAVDPSFFEGAVFPVWSDTTSTFYPNANPETSSVDGSAQRRNNSGESWSAVTTGAGTAADDTGDPDADFYAQAYTSSGQWLRLFRGFFLFDTSAIDDTETVVAATTSLRGTSKQDDGGNTPNLNIYSSSPSSNTAIAAGDYASVGSTAFSSAISYSSWSTSGYNDFVLNGSGLAAVDKGGVTKFSTRNANYDVAGSGPTWGSSQEMSLYSNYAEASGTSTDPKLVVTSNSVVPPPTTSTNIQDLTYTYDAAGNITRITDISNTATFKTVDFGYDDLYRLTTASTSNATTTGAANYRQTFGYNAVGNMATSSTLGTYSYNSTNLANPHAVTSITASSSSSSVSTSTITLDATSSSITTGFGAGPVTKMWTATTSGSDRLLVLYADIWQDTGGIGTITSATYNGTALAKAASNRGTGMACEMWYLGNPTLGANTLSVTVTGATDAIKLAAADFNGVNQTSPFDASSTASDTSGNPTIGLTTVTGSDLVTATLDRFSTTDATTNRTSLYKDKVTSTLGAASYQVATAPGSYSDTYTGSAAQDWCMNAVAFKPATTTVITGSDTTLYYDNDGNLASSTYGSTTWNYTWDYKNQLTQAATGTATTTFAYDFAGSRVRMTVNGAGTTTYPNQYFNLSSATSTKHIYANGELIATIETASAQTASTIVFDASSTQLNAGFNAGPVTKVWSHTVTGSNPVIVLSADIFQDVGGTGSITSATWNGGAFTLASTTRTGTKSAEMWYLVATTTGSKNMSVTVTGATDDIKLSVASFTGVSQSSPLDAVAVSGGSSGNPSASVTTLAANDVVVATLVRHSTTDATTSKTAIYKDRTSSILGAASYQLATSTGTYTDTYVGSASQNWSMVIAAFKPATSGVQTPTIRYIHTDHLMGTAVVTNASGTIVETSDYYPFGEARLDTGSYSDQRKFTGHEYDPSTNLSYMKSRYYNGSRANFLSQDPAFLAAGTPSLKNASGQDNQKYLSDPQQLNSYGYARNNPLKYIDPTGKALWDIGGSVSAGEYPLGISAGVLIEPGVGYRTYFYWTAGESYGASAKYDPEGSLNQEQPDRRDLVTRGYVTAPFGFSSVQAEQNISNPFDFSKGREESNGWAFGLEIGAVYGVGGEGKIKYFEKYKKKQSQQSDSPSISSGGSGGSNQGSYGGSRSAYSGSSGGGGGGSLPSFGSLKEFSIWLTTQSGQPGAKSTVSASSKSSKK